MQWWWAAFWSANRDNAALPALSYGWWWCVCMCGGVPAAMSGIAAGDGAPYWGFNTPLDQADMIHVGWVWIWVPVLEQHLSCQCVFVGIWRWALLARGCSLKQSDTTSGWSWSSTSQNRPLNESHVAHLIPLGTWCTRPLILVTEKNLRAD